MELAVLSAIEHGQNPDIELATRIASVAIIANAHIDAERSRLYLDLMDISLSPHAPEAIEATMNSLGFEYQGNFARRYFGQGKAEGKAEGLVEGQMKLILKMLAGRFGPLPDTIQTRVRGANDEELDALAERMLTAQSLEQALGSLSTREPE